MIIFYNRVSKEVVSVVEGRVHDPHILENHAISIEGVPDTDILRFVVPFEPVKKPVKQPIEEMRVVDNTTGRVEKVVIGYRDAEEIVDYIPEVPFKDKIIAFEKKEENIYDYQVVLDEHDNLIDFVKK
jgi:hypothetical protein